MEKGVSLAWRRLLVRYVDQGNTWIVLCNITSVVPASSSFAGSALGNSMSAQVQTIRHAYIEGGNCIARVNGGAPQRVANMLLVTGAAVFIVVAARWRPRMPY